MESGEERWGTERKKGTQLCRYSSPLATPPPPTAYSPKSESASTDSTSSMEELAHNVWATPHDIDLQQMEYTRRQEDLARNAAHRQRQQQQSAADDLAAQIGSLGYGQSNSDPAFIQAGVEQRIMQRRLGVGEMVSPTVAGYVGLGQGKTVMLKATAAAHGPSGRM